MKLLRYHNCTESTDEFETGDIANAEFDTSPKDKEQYVTIYAECGGWYLILNEKDINLLKAVLNR